MTCRYRARIEADDGCERGFVKDSPTADAESARVDRVGVFK